MKKNTMFYSQVHKKGVIRIENVLWGSDVSVSSPIRPLDEYPVKILLGGNGAHVRELYAHIRRLEATILRPPYEGRWKSVEFFPQETERQTLEIVYHPHGSRRRLYALLVFALRWDLASVCNLKLAFRSLVRVIVDSRQYQQHVGIPDEIQNGSVMLPMVQIPQENALCPHGYTN